MITEIWKDIKGYEGHYQISNLGNVTSIKRGLMNKNRIDRDGYLQIRLSKNGIKTLYFIHRLSALTFICNPENKRTVNHINGIKTDNRVVNLEWATDKENTQHYHKYLKNINTQLIK